MQDMDDATLVFERLRPRLHGIAYRMLGSAAEAEKVMQDAWLRWQEAAEATLESAEARLVFITTRLCLERLRQLKQERGEPLLTGSPATPEQMLERADDLVVAFVALVERLAPEARAAFLLREMFDADYDDLSRAIGKSEAASRQMVHRAKKQLRDERPRYAGSPDIGFRLLSSFAEAMMRGDFAALKSMLADDVELIGDGGGQVPSFGKPLLGSQRVAQFFLAASRRYGNALRIELAVINGQWGLLRYVDGALESAQSYETDGERIVRIHVQRDPDNLAAAFEGC